MQTLADIKTKTNFFNNAWFYQHQRTLLFFLNAPFIRWIMRLLLEIRDVQKKNESKIEWNRKITGITENIVCFETGKKTEKGEHIHRCHIWGRAGYSEFLAKKLRLLWVFMHTWDYLADAFLPRLSFGFTDYNPDAGSPAANVVDGAMEKDGSANFSTFRGYTTATAAYPAATNVNAIYMAKSGSTFSVFIRGVFGFYNLTTFSGVIATAILKLWRTNNSDSFTGMNISLGKATPAADTDLATTDFDIATKFTLTRQAADVDIDLFDGAPQNWNLNSTGVSSCNTARTGSGKIMLATLHSADFDNSDPSAGGDGTSLVTVDTKDHATSSHWPTLTVEVAVANNMMYAND